YPNNRVDNTGPNPIAVAFNVVNYQSLELLLKHGAQPECKEINKFLDIIKTHISQKIQKPLLVAYLNSPIRLSEYTGGPLISSLGPDVRKYLLESRLRTHIRNYLQQTSPS